MSSFLKRLIQAKPDLINSTVYFCVGKRRSLPCIIRDDGTLSPLCDESLRFDSASSLVEAWKSKKFSSPDCSVGCKVKPTSYKFSSDIFLKKGRKDLLRSSLQEEPPRKNVGGDAEVTNNILDSDLNALGSTGTSDSSNDKNGNERLANIGVGGARRRDLELVDLDVGQEINGGGRLESNAPASTRKDTAQEENDVAMILLSIGNDDQTAKVLKKRQCPGFGRSPYEELIKNRLWDGERRSVCPVELGSADRCWSKQCYRQMVGRKVICPECSKSKNSLQTSQKRMLEKPANEERRIMQSSIQFLSFEDQQKKAEILKRRSAEKNRKIQTMVWQNRRLQNELDKYRPKYVNNRRAVRSLVEYLDGLEEKIHSPTCKWILENGDSCGHEIQSIGLLRQHVLKEHLRSQFSENSKKLTMEREYRCHWTGCRRRAPFRKFDRIRAHLVVHTGHSKTEMHLSAMRDQLTNLVREPTARRYSKSTKTWIASLRDEGDQEKMQSQDSPGTSAPNI